MNIIGKGSYGVVCTAHDDQTDTDIAIKKIKPIARDDWDARLRFWKCVLRETVEEKGWWMNI